MILSKDFLLGALPQASFFCQGKFLDKEASAWNFYSNNQAASVAVDSRLLATGEIFVALKGERVDGHSYLPDVLKGGAVAFVVSIPPEKCLKHLDLQLVGNRLFIYVPDTYQALLDLAKAWRRQLTIPVVGITGSIGKTTTKEILRSILQKAHVPFYTSLKNQNTFIGLCINILRVPLDCRVAAFEVGVDSPGEMDIKADILRPSIGLITCIAHSHVLRFGSLQGIAYEKRQLFKYFSSQDVGIVFGDQPLLAGGYYTHPIAKFGFKTKNQVQGRKVKMTFDQSSLRGMTSFMLKWYEKRAPISIVGNHLGLVHNALAASSIAYLLNIPFEAIVEGIESYSGFEHRFESRHIRGGRGVVISDCYNANPESMRAALTAFANLPAQGKKIVVLGDMLELGEKEAFWHRQIGRFLNKTDTIQAVVLVGQRARLIAQPLAKSLPIELADDWKMAKLKLETLLAEKNSVVLVKASKDVALYKMVDEIT